MSIRLPNPRIGELRPSQLLYTYGIGAVVDLAHVSVMVMGLEDWNEQTCRELPERRLLAAVQEALGAQVSTLVAPPMPQDDAFLAVDADTNTVGLPVAPFPRWMRCPACNLLARLDSGLLSVKSSPFRPGQTRYVHANCNKANQPVVVPARFLLACESGHLDDFPWVWFAHQGKPDDCPAILELRELGVSGEAADVEVRCTTCGSARRLVDAFGDEAPQNLPGCRGRRPHLRDFENEPCRTQPRAILLGASNSWFGTTLSALSIPGDENPLSQLVERYWDKLRNVTAPAVVEFLRAANQLGPLDRFCDEDILKAITAHRTGTVAKGDDASDLRGPEWRAFSNPAAAARSEDFVLREVQAPRTFASVLERVVLADRLREVTALVGFTRIDSPGNFSSDDTQLRTRRAPISRKAPSFAPAAEVRGEGIFLQFKEELIASWVAGNAAREGHFLEAQRRWRTARRIEPANKGFPGLRYVLLHSLSHVLIRQFALECGYGAASLRERIYAREADAPGGPMAGILISTAAPDSEGTLGGLVALGEPLRLGPHLERALEHARLCSSDPLCAEHAPTSDDLSLHFAACHSCLFAPETSCESGNRYLDRAALVATLADVSLSPFFVRTAR